MTNLLNKKEQQMVKIVVGTFYMLGCKCESAILLFSAYTSSFATRLFETKK
jgi:hypothetical protein